MNLYIVDAFTCDPFGGNPAAVCPVEAPLDAALMQKIASEMNLSETAFFLPRPGPVGGKRRAPRISIFDGSPRKSRSISAATRHSRLPTCSGKRGG